jgi:hypothetical protein
MEGGLTRRMAVGDGGREKRGGEGRKVHERKQPMGSDLRKGAR